MANRKIAPAPYSPDVAVPPGATIRDMLQDFGMTQAELAHRMKRPANKVNEIIQRKRQLTVETALELELTLGLPADFWINLEKNYQLTKARLAEDSRLEEEAAVLKQFPVNAMCKLGWVEKKDTVRLQVRELLAFFGVASFSQLKSITNLAPAWRKSQKKQPCPYALCAWLRKGVLEASQLTLAKFNGRALQKHIDDLRLMTTFDEFQAPLVEICAKHGIAVVFVPHLPKSYVNGAAYWLGDKAVIQLSLRYKWADIIWFNFFHELAHILFHSSKKGKAFLDDTFESNGAFSADDPSHEEEANNFAADGLIPPDRYEELLLKIYQRPHVIKSFAQDIGVHAGVVVGRLHHDKKIHPSLLNDLRIQIEWASGMEKDDC